MPPADRRPDAERGAALLTVLMLVAIVAVLAGAALEHLRLATRLAGNAAAGAQARAFAYAAETLATTRVTTLLGQNPKRVTLAGGWSNRATTLPLPGGGMATVRVVDGGNCFNLNGLVGEATKGIYIANGGERLEFARLMRLVGVPAQAAEQIAGAASDWIDTDQDVQASGAEDATYLGRAQPYRTAGTLMADPSELRAVEGMTPQYYARIRPWVCTLPVAQPSPLNVNTLLPEQAPLIAMLLPDTLSVDAGRALLLRRPPQGYGTTAEFWKGLTLQGMVPDPSAMAQTAVTTRWFALTIDIAADEARLQEHALIDASRLPARLATRQWGEAS